MQQGRVFVEVGRIESMFGRNQVFIVEFVFVAVAETDQRAAASFHFVLDAVHQFLTIAGNDAVADVAVANHMQHLPRAVAPVDANPNGTQHHAGEEVLVNLDAFP